MMKRLRVRKQVVSINYYFLLVEKGDLDELARLLFLHPDKLEERDRNGFTLLLYALSHNQMDIAAFLLSKGANPNVQANGGQTCLMWACHYGDLNLLARLIQHGLDLNAESDVYYWDEEDEEDDPYILTTTVAHWLPNEHMISLLDFFEQHEHLMTEDLKKYYKRSRLFRITHDQ